MIKHYLKTAGRNFWKNKVFSLINISGLSIGIACCFIIGIYISHELSYDRFFPDSERIFRVVQEQDQAGDKYQVAITPAPLAESLKEKYPEVDEATCFSTIFDKRLFTYKDKVFEEDKVLYVDTAFFKLFPFRVKKGSLQSFFSSPNSILFTESMAHKYFGNEDPLGKIITINKNQQFEVKTIIEDNPENWHMKFSFLLPLDNLRSHRDFTSWGNNWMYTYILLKETANRGTFETKVRNLLSDNIGSPDWQPKLYLQALEDIHLHSNFDFSTDIADTASLQSIYLFGATGLIIMIISCINFINLTTARSYQRDKETGIRKVTGASRKQLIFQFLGESTMYVIISMFLAIFLVWLLLPWLANLSGLPLALNFSGTKTPLILLLLILGMTELLTGVYPALFVSGFNMAHLLGGKILPNKNTIGHRFSLRKILVVCQFTFSVILIVSAIMIRKQMHYVLNRDLGFNKEQVLYIPVKGDLGNEIRYQSFKNTLLQQSSIAQVARSNSLPIHHQGSFGGIEWEGMPSGHQDFLMNYIEADESFVKTYGLRIIDGQNFRARSPGDSTDYYLINQTALKVMQMDNPVGKTLEDGIIVGVVKDFSFQSAYNAIEPIILRYGPENRNLFISIRTAPENMSTAIKEIKQAYQQFNPGYPVEYYFLNNSIAAMYDLQIRSDRFINLFAALAVFISCLGLFGLTTFSAQQKIKEIGIRKVNGAKIWEVMTMLNKDFVKWVAIAFVIATPVSWYVMNRWLESFAYKTSLSWWIFALAGIFALGIALLTVSWQSWKAATKNPVEALRYE